MANLYGPVLIVEDVPNVLELLEVTLRFKGYPVATATNGQEALELARRLKPSVVVIDINMPLMNGIEATAQIRTALPDTIVIGMSVNASVDNQEAMRTAGASVLLPKEAAGDQLYGAIQSAMKGLSEHTGPLIRSQETRL